MFDGDTAIPAYDRTNKKNLLLLIQLRWLAIGGQVTTIIFVHFYLGIALPLLPMAAVILFLIGLNVVSLLRHRNQVDVSNTELFLELLLDVAALTVQLFLSGGASNPFVSLYLLQVILGAVLLKAWSTWALVAITSGCFVALTFSYRPIAIPHVHGTDFLNLHIQGMFICFLLAAILLVLFITRIQRNLRARDAQSAEEDHIVRIGLLASGAAHELGTPLSTVSVILSDWQQMPKFNSDPEVAEELRDMLGQLDRCKGIVSGILTSSGVTRGEGAARTTVNAFLDGLVADWQASHLSMKVDYTNSFTPDVPIVSDTVLKQVMFNIFDNACETSPGWMGVTACRNGEDLVITVNDAGPGFDREILAEFGTPYRSSKQSPGSGLGLFLVVNVLRKLGGTATPRNRTEGGASVTLQLPLASLSAGV